MKVHRLFSLLLILTILSCSVKQLAGGSDMPNGITTGSLVYGTVYTSSGAAAKNTKVRLVPAAYDPVKNLPLSDKLSSLTDSLGRYSFRIRDTGTYSLEAVHGLQKTKALVFGLDVKGDTVPAPRCTVKVTGAIKVYLPDSADLSTGYVYIPSTTISFKTVKDRHWIMMDSLPVGIMQSIVYSESASLLQRVLRHNVLVGENDTTEVFLPELSYVKQLFCNTTASGANVLGNVYHFPLLVRLTAANFDFLQAKPDGSDLRFTKSDNTFLPYEIERFDQVGQVAEIWVNVDTVFGNDSSQFIRMYWGANTGFVTMPMTNSTSVFDTANGFGGTWHLDNNCNDATFARLHGTNFGTIDTVGIIGNCKKFRGNDSIKIDGLMGKPSCVTLSAWVRLDTMNYTSGSDVVSIGNAVLIRMDDGYLSKGTHGDYKVLGDTTYDCIATGQYLAKTGWHYLVYTYNCNALLQSMYIDGELVGTHAVVTSINYGNIGTATYIGIHGNGVKKHNVTGLIDEVRICKVPRSPDWVRLCFKNQQANDCLIDFK